MIGFGVCVGPSDRFDRLARPALDTHYRDAPVLVRHHQRSIAAAYNSIVEEATSRGLDGVVLIHDDVVLRDGHLLDRLSALFADPTIGIVGAVGSRGAASIRWRRGECFGRAPDPRGDNDFGGGTHDVDSVDGLLLAVPRSVFGRARFDAKGFPGFHGYDADFCASIRGLGLRVLVTDIDLFHDSSGVLSDPVAFRRAELRYERKWQVPVARHGALGWALRYRFAGRPTQLRGAVRATRHQVPR